MLAAARKVERQTLGGDAAVAHFESSRKDVKNAGHGGDACAGVLPALKPAAESAGVGHDINRDAVFAHGERETVDSAIRIAGGAGHVDAVDVRLAIAALPAAHACGYEQDPLRRVRVVLAQPAVHDFGGNHVEVILDARPSARQEVFAPEQTRVFAGEVGCNPARIGTESAFRLALEFLKQLDGGAQPIGCLWGGEIREIASPVIEPPGFVPEFAGGLEPFGYSHEALDGLGPFFGLPADVKRERVTREPGARPVNQWRGSWKAFACQVEPAGN
jgi:hypothetical protein